MAVSMARRIAKRLGLQVDLGEPIPQLRPLVERRRKTGEMRQVLQTVLREQGRRASLAADVPAVVAALRAYAPRDTGALAESFHEGPNGVRLSPDGTKIWVETDKVYGPIQDVGGYAGKDGSAHLAGHYYLAKAASAVGLDPSLVEWAPTQWD